MLRFILSQRRRVDSEEENLVYESVGEKPKLWSIMVSNGRINREKVKSS